MVLAEAIGLDKDKPNRVTKVAVKMRKCKGCLCPRKNYPFPFQANCGPRAIAHTCYMACLGMSGSGGHSPPQDHYDLTLFLGIHLGCHQVFILDPVAS